MIDRTFKFLENKHCFKVLTLNKESELRLRISFEPNLYIQVEEGSAEISGMEITKYFFYRLPKVLSIPIYTWGGCKIKIVAPNHYALSSSGGVSTTINREISWNEKTWQPNEDNPHYMQANIFGVMDALRQHALVGKHFGPKLLVLGSPASGKSELARTFVNYSVKIGWPTAFIELDPERPETSVPGMVTASVLSGEYLSVRVLNNCLVRWK
jgi:N-terminal beta-sandwich domain of polyadenylation factor/mRNA cleavage and polyadenylation factor CLP1 P-loop